MVQRQLIAIGEAGSGRLSAGCGETAWPAPRVQQVAEVPLALKRSEGSGPVGGFPVRQSVGTCAGSRSNWSGMASNVVKGHPCLLFPGEWPSR